MTEIYEPVKRPRIVSRHPDDHALSEEPTLDDVYDFFSGSETRLAALKTKITERETVLFDLAMSREMIQDNPSLGPCTKDERRGDCNCADCSLERVVSMESAVKFGLRRLRTLHSKLS